jgi:uncharacterized protein
VGERENTQLVKQAYQHFKNADIQSILGLLSEDVEWTLFEIEGVPFSGTRRGPERVGEYSLPKRYCTLSPESWSLKATR